MFARLPVVLGSYLEKVGGLERASLGEAKAISVNPGDQQQLLGQLHRESKFNNRLIVCVTVLHFLLFILAAALVFYHRDSPKVISLILGGSFLSLLPVINSLSRLWREKSAIDMLGVILPTLTPEQSIKVIQSIYFGTQSASRPRRKQPKGAGR